MSQKAGITQSHYPLSVPIDEICGKKIFGFRSLTLVSIYLDERCQEPRAKSQLLARALCIELSRKVHRASVRAIGPCWLELPPSGSPVQVEPFRRPTPFPLEPSPLLAAYGSYRFGFAGTMQGIEWTELCAKLGGMSCGYQLNPGKAARGRRPMEHLLHRCRISVGSGINAALAVGSPYLNFRFLIQAGGSRDGRLVGAWSRMSLSKTRLTVE